ncbi:integrase catalytic domain-containing protein [Trichonephila clavipes]|nr:integrase catalytic domain-containing protein [Trichonephila clavipes]
MDADKIKNKRKALKSSATKFVNNLNTILVHETNVHSLEIVCNQLIEKIYCLKIADNELLSVIDVLDIQKVEQCESFMENLISYKCKISQKIASLTPLIVPPTIVNTTNLPSSTIDTLTSEPRSSIKLPKLTMNKFYGDHKNWLEFLSQFENAIDKNSSLSKIEETIYNLPQKFGRRCRSESHFRFCVNGNCDVLGGQSTVASTYTTSVECVQIFKEANMPLHKWATNSAELRELWEKNGFSTETSSNSIGQNMINYKVLGISWDTDRDVFYFDIESLLSFISKRTNTKRTDRTITTSFVTSKSRVAPLKNISLPRLELMGALLFARLCCKVSKTLKLEKSCFFHTDSSIVYHWIQRESFRFKPFVKNRIEEIQKLTEPSKWHQCPGKENPADIISRGISVRKYSLKPANQITAQLPKDRLLENPPFEICGLDFAGPILYKCVKEVKKCYFVIFTCAVTRGIHLELISSMSTKHFLLAFRRFISRRGSCSVVYSDNAKSLQAAFKDLIYFAKILKNSEFKDFISSRGITWKFIVERAPWWGGFYERLVKSVKDPLRKIIGKALLTFEELVTILVEIEYIVNSRPLTYVTDDFSEPNSLTPLDFLQYGRKSHDYPLHFAELANKVSNRESLIKRKQYQSTLSKNFWNKRKIQYLLDLKTVHHLKSPKMSKLVMLCSSKGLQSLNFSGTWEQFKKLLWVEVDTHKSLYRQNQEGSSQETSAINIPL